MNFRERNLFIRDTEHLNILFGMTIPSSPSEELWRKVRQGHETAVEDGKELGEWTLKSSELTETDERSVVKVRELWKVKEVISWKVKASDGFEMREHHGIVTLDSSLTRLGYKVQTARISGGWVKGQK